MGQPNGVYRHCSNFVSLVSQFKVIKSVVPFLREPLKKRKHGCVSKRCFLEQLLVLQIEFHSICFGVGATSNRLLYFFDLGLYKLVNVFLKPLKGRDPITFTTSGVVYIYI